MASVCAVHPERQAVDICSRCGAFACADCYEIYEQKPYCARCLGRVRGLTGGSWMSIAAGICGFISIGCGPLGLIALGLAGVDLALIAAGRSRRGGLTLDLLALAMGVVGLAVGAYILWRLGTGQVNEHSFD